MDILQKMCYNLIFKGHISYQNIGDEVKPKLFELQYGQYRIKYNFYDLFNQFGYCPKEYNKNELYNWKDISKIETSRGERNVITSDQYLYELSELKAKLSTQLIETIKETSFDCYIYSNGKCMSFGDPLSDKFSYVPNYANQQSDAIAQTNKQILEWEARKIEINGVNYAAKEINKKSYLLYD
jgi:hypothetical protein